MPGHGAKTFALVIRSAPFQGRSARDQLDIALAAATLDYALELYFLGPGALQLLASHDPGAAGLPRGLRGWKSLPGLTRVRAWVTPEAMQELADGGALLLEVTPIARSDMAERLAACDQVLVV